MAPLIRGYFDDSGSTLGSEYHVVAGLLAEVGQWKEFRKEWRRLLKIPPGLRYFKMAEAEGMHGQFDSSRGWTKQLRRERVRALSQAVKEHSHCGMVSVVGNHTYDAAMRGRVDPEWDHPYLPCFWGILGCVAHYMGGSRYTRKPILVFDVQDCETQAHQLATWFRGTSGGRWIGRPQFHDDRLAIGIQAGDLVAWHWRRQCLDLGLRSPRGRAAFHTLATGECVGENWDRDKLRRWRESLHNAYRGIPRGRFRI